MKAHLALLGPKTHRLLAFLQVKYISSTGEQGSYGFGQVYVVDQIGRVVEQEDLPELYTPMIVRGARSN